jgi:multicomponent K+:H+ antiporter subunit E
MLNQSLAPAHLLLGLILALVLSRWPRPEPKDTGTEPPTAASGTRTSTVARALTAARLGAIVLYDIGVANLQVAWRILGSQDSLKPGYVVVPVTVRDPLAISLLASIITMTPGTLSAELSDDRTHLRVHVLDLDDADDVVAQIQQRYEAPILELFA